MLSAVHTQSAMSKSTKKHPDLNQIASRIVQEAAGELPKTEKGEGLTGRKAASRKGGKAGGGKYFATLTDEQKSELGKKAREARRIKEALASNEASAKTDQLNKVN